LRNTSYYLDVYNYTHPQTTYANMAEYMSHLSQLQVGRNLLQKYYALLRLGQGGDIVAINEYPMSCIVLPTDECRENYLYIDKVSAFFYEAEEIASAAMGRLAMNAARSGEIDPSYTIEPPLASEIIKGYDQFPCNENSWKTNLLAYRSFGGGECPDEGPSCPDYENHCGWTDSPQDCGLIDNFGS
jgi:hypothetical protein